MNFIVYATLFFSSLAQADVLDEMMKASNWYHKDRYPKECVSSFIKNMKTTKRKSPREIEVSSNQIGLSPIAFVELNHSAKKENLPVYGQGAILDIFIKKKKTEDGYDYWVECPPQK